MRREEALSRLRANRDRLVALGVRHLYLYGSVARDEAGMGSDVDLLVDPADASFTAYNLVALKNGCRDILGVGAEVHDYGGYERLDAVRARIADDLIRVF